MVDVNGSNGVGVNPWWTFEEDNIPGVGHYFANVGAGQNLVVQSDDMSIRNRGLDIAFRRTYNSAGRHDWANTDQSGPSNYGEGWTNTFDAHIAWNNAGGITVFDSDGTAFHYTPNGQGGYVPPPGQHAMLTWDGSLGYFWTKKSGTVYYFCSPADANYAQWAGYAGRVYQIWGRNHQNKLEFFYGFDDPNNSSAANLQHITVLADNIGGVGRRTELAFTNVNGRRLLTTLQWPTGTQVTYGYDTAGNLLTAAKPGNNNGNRVEQYGYFPGTHLLQQATSPRWDGTSGAYLTFSYYSWLGIAEIDYHGVVNPTITDDTGTSLLQPNAPPGMQQYRTVNLDASGTTTSWHDSDGHQRIYTYSGGLVTQTQATTGTTVLTSTRIFDGDNNVLREDEPRAYAPGAAAGAYATKYAYDLNGNTIAIGEPPITTASGAVVRPTKLYSYDQYNNMTAQCDEAATNAAGLSWNVRPTPPPPGQGLCALTPAATQFQWTPTPDEPYGQLRSIRSPATTVSAPAAPPAAPSGYLETFSYETAKQGAGSIDFGLPTLVTGMSYQQVDGSWKTPTQSFTYDANGNMVSIDDGNGATTISYDGSGTNSASRPIARTDADGVTGYRSYYPDGSVSVSETAYEHTRGTGITYAYDLDGNATSETHHYGCVPMSPCTSGTTTRVYDAADRLVETMMPRQPDSASSTGADYALPRTDAWPYQWKKRYFYDLTNGGTPYGMTGRAYGGMFAEQEYTSPSNNQGWYTIHGSTFDALDRQLQEWDYGSNWSQIGAPASRSNIYDSNGQLGLLAFVGIAASTEGKYLTYDARSQLTGEFFMDPTGARYTPSRNFQYDLVGRVISVQSGGPGAGFGTMSYAYDQDANLLSRTESGSTYDDAPSTISYSYYPDGKRRGVSVAAQTAGGFSQNDLMTYVYRADGNLTGKHVQVPFNVATSFADGWMTWTYSAAGRLSTRSDPFTGQAIPGVYGAASAARRIAVARAVAGAPKAASLMPISEGLKKAQPAAPSLPDISRRGGSSAGTVPALTAPAVVPNIVLAPNVIGGPCPLGELLGKSVDVVAPCCGVDCSPPPTPTPTGPPTPTPTPVPPRPFVPIKAVPDQFGRISSYQLPSGSTYNQFTYDDEGSLTDFWGYGVSGNGAYPAKHINNEFNVRGELTGQHFFDGASTAAFTNAWPNFAARSANGTMLPWRENVVLDYNGIGTTLNTYNGKLVQQIQYVTYNTYFGAGCKRVQSQFQWSQDPGGRDTQAQAWQIQEYPPDCSPPPYLYGSISRTYDYSDHLMQWKFTSGNFWPGPGQGLLCNPATKNGLPPLSAGYTGERDYGWGPEGKLVQVQDSNGTRRALHWDGDDLLFVTNGSGALDEIKIGSDASINAQGKLIVWDRDWAGAIVMAHDANGYSAWLPPNPYQQSCTPNSPPPASPGYDSPQGPAIGQFALDGYSDGVNIFQGARTYDTQTTQWTTQDAFAGVVHDPATQKPYAWNRNNPFKYSDPTGFDPMNTYKSANLTAWLVDWHKNFQGTKAPAIIAYLNKDTSTLRLTFQDSGNSDHTVGIPVYLKSFGNFDADKILSGAYSLGNTGFFGGAWTDRTSSDRRLGWASIPIRTTLGVNAIPVINHGGYSDTGYDVMIHGGGSMLPGDSMFDARQPLKGTKGCVRMCNIDVFRLANLIIDQGYPIKLTIGP